MSDPGLHGLLYETSLLHNTTRENVSLGFANNKGADKPAQPRRLISALVIRFWEVSYLNLLQAKFQISS